MAEIRAGAPRAPKAPQNIVGPQVRRIRVQQGLSQPKLATRCQLKGYDLSREGLSKIEARVRYVTDAEIVLLAEALGVPHALLFPAAEELAMAIQSFRLR